MMSQCQFLTVATMQEEMVTHCNSASEVSLLLKFYQESRISFHQECNKTSVLIATLCCTTIHQLNIVNFIDLPIYKKSIDRKCRARGNYG